MVPGSEWPSVDEHGETGEQSIVISGEVIEGDERYQAGTYLSFAPGSSHQPRAESRADPCPPRRWASATAPTLVMHGGESDAWLRNVAGALAGILHEAKRRTLNGQDHSAVFTAPEAVAAALVEFFAVESAGW